MTDWYIPPLRPLFSSAVWSGPAPHVYLTFDDGPHIRATDTVLQVLGSASIPGTFFLTGMNAEALSETVRRIDPALHSIGNHGYSHRSYLMMRWDDIDRDIRRGEEAIERITGQQSTLFRPPYGRMRRSLPAKLAARGIRTVLWGVNSWDYDPGVSDDKVVAMVVRRTRPGDIVLLHDNEKTSGRLQACLPELIAGLKARGHSFARL